MEAIVASTMNRHQPTLSNQNNFLTSMVENMTPQIQNVLIAKLFECVGSFNLSELRRCEHTIRNNLFGLLETLDMKNVLRDWNSALQLAKDQIMHQI